MNQSKQLETSTQIAKNSEVTAVLPLLCQRTGCELSIKQMEFIGEDIASEFLKTDISIIHSALRKGGLGYYGITYKITTQVLCSWIRSEIKHRANYNEDGTQKFHM